MKIEKELEIRRMLGDKYHLYTEYGKGVWKLFRKYDNPDVYFSEDNKPILTSEKNTEEELFKYAKEHREKDFSDVMRLCVYISVGLCTLNVLGLVFKWGDFVRGIIIGAILMLVLMDIIVFEMSDHNFRIRMRELKDGMRDLLEGKK